MSVEFFRPRDLFDFSKDTLDIGVPMPFASGNFLKHFFTRFFHIASSRWEEFYTHHLKYYLGKHNEGREEIYFKVLWDLIQRRLKTLLAKDIYASKTHIRDQQEIELLEKFTKFLIIKDKWTSHETDKAIILRQQTEIFMLQTKTESLESSLKEAKKLETKDQINIHKDYLLTFVDLCLQLQGLKLDDKKELVFSQTQAVWMKMICRYFTINNEPVNYNTLKRYFSPDPENPANVKHAPVPDNKKLFKITPAKKRS